MENEMQEYLINEGLKDLTLLKPTSDEKFTQISGNELKEIINLSREARETMGNLGRKKMEKIYDVNFVIEKNLQAIKKFAK